MRKLLITSSALIAVFLVLLVIFPSLFYSFPLGQKIILRFEGDRAAHFFFNENGSSKDTLYMEGVIYSGTLEDFSEIIESHPEVKTLTMVEVPGSIDDEINVQVSRIIRTQGINTYIPENGWVASGGTDMFLAGKERYRHPNTKIGVHSWAGEKMKATKYPRDHEVHRKYLDYYNDITIDIDFYWFTLEVAPAEKMHWMTEQEIDKYRVISEPDLNDLLKIQKELSSDRQHGRKTGDNLLSQDYIVNYFEDIGLEVFGESYRKEFDFFNRYEKKDYRGTNIIGYIEGNKTPDNYIVIGAHFDHMGIMNDSIYNGADDNASGTAAMMVLAKYFTKHPPDHSLIFAAFDAEEMGLHGSGYFVSNPLVELNKIVLNINMDMISRSDKNELYVVGTRFYCPIYSFESKYC